MTETLFPGVFVEELPTTVHSIEGVSTSTAAFLGTGPRDVGPALVTSFGEFEQQFGSDATGFLPLAVRGFFENGGHRCQVIVRAGSDPVSACLDALADQRFSLLCCPGESQLTAAGPTMVEWCERRKDVFCILQSPAPALPHEMNTPPVRSSYAGYYYPWLAVASLDGQSSIAIPPAGHVCGVFARTDVERGVHHAPAGVRVMGVKSLSVDLDAPTSDLLNAQGVNVLRTFPSKGVVIWGGRTTSNAAGEFRYVNVRRLLIFLEESIKKGLQWAVFEPNGLALWLDVTQTIDNFLRTVWKTGALVGSTADNSFFIRCDRTTMTQDDLDAGRLVALVGVAPLRPGEFVVVKITVQTAHDQHDAGTK